MDPSTIALITQLIQSNYCTMNAKTPIAMYWKAETKPSDSENWTFKGIEPGFMGQPSFQVWIKPNPDFEKFKIASCPINQQRELQHYYEPREKR